MANKEKTDGSGSFVTDEDPQHKCRFHAIPKRFLLALVAFVGILNFFSLRLNLSVALVDMVSSTSEDSVTSNTECPNMHNGTYNFTTYKKTSEFSWDSDVQGYVLGGYYYGYTVLQNPGGVIAQRIGGRFSFGFGLLAMSICTMLTPVAARIHVYALVAVRVLLGAAGGVCYPGVHVILAKWAPLGERSRMTSFIFAAARLGPVVSQAATGVLIESGFLEGWPSAFYVLGSIAALTCVVWFLVISESPATHSTISDKERRYILRTVEVPAKRLKTPWSVILTSMPFWALLVANVCSMWGLFTMFSYLPSYIEHMLHFSTKDSGFLSALPYLVCWFFVLLVGFIADFLQHKGWTVRSIRKLMNTIGLVVPAAILAAVGYTGCDVTVNVVCLTLSIGFTGFTFAGFYANHIDIAPNFSGVLFGISNSAASVTGFAAPYLVGLIMKQKQTQAEWRLVFLICSGVYVFGAVFFLAFGDGEPQPWSLSTLLLNNKKRTVLGNDNSVFVMDQLADTVVPNGTSDHGFEHSKK